jgi:hypothetical protein
MMKSLSNKLNECDTLGKGEDWAMATERELTTLATMLLGRRPLRFGAICDEMQGMGGGGGSKEAFGLGRERGLSDLVQEIPYGFFQQLYK